MIVTHAGGKVKHGYQIERVERTGEKTRIVLAADHWLRIDGDTTQEIFSKWNTFHGRNTVLIYTRALRADGTIRPEIEGRSHARASRRKHPNKRTEKILREYPIFGLVPVRCSTGTGG